MQAISNPNRRLMTICGALGLIGVLGGLLGLAVGGDNGFVWGLLGLILGGSFALVVPIAWVMGKSQTKEIAALIAGQGLLAHWTFDPDEWQRYTENEYDRGMAQTRKISLWTGGIALAVMLGITLIAGALEGLVLLVDLGVAVAFTALLGGSSYLMTRSALAINRRGVGQVYIGATAIYFGDRFYSWNSRWAALEKVSFEAGDPSVVQFNYRYSSGENTSHVEVRIPVPRGREAEAAALVGQYYAAS